MLRFKSVTGEVFILIRWSNLNCVSPSSLQIWYNLDRARSIVGVAALICVRMFNVCPSATRLPEVKLNP